METIPRPSSNAACRKTNKETTLDQSYSQLIWLFWVSCEEVCSTKNLAWAAATKIRIISRNDAKHVLSDVEGAAKKQNKFPNLAFLAPWREEYPSPIKDLRFSRKFESR
jgi:hypothetical protein